MALDKTKNKDLIIVTYDREQSLKVLLNSIDLSNFNNVVIVKDGGGSNYSPEFIDKLKKNNINFSESKVNVGVGICKQRGISILLDELKTTSDHIFILEDDLIIKNNKVWDYYIDFSMVSGVWHTNWNDYRYKKYKFELDYGDGLVGVVTKDVEGSFSYFHKNIFKFCEFPSDMKNAFEHISVELQLIEKDLLPPFWNFICPKNTGDYLELQAVDSTITDRDGYSENYSKSNAAFTKRHNLYLNSIPDVDTDFVLGRLKFLKENYAKV